MKPSNCDLSEFVSAAAVIKKLESRWKSGIQLGGRTFPTKATVERHVREMFTRYANVTDTEPVTGADRAFVDDLIDLHPRKAQLFAGGVAHVLVQRVPCNEAQKRFLAILNDGSLTDFAWRRCLSGRSQAQYVSAICRHLIKPQIEAFRERFWIENRGGAVCPILNVPITPTSSHVDHAAPATFATLVMGWLAADQLDVDDIEITFATGYETQHSFTDALLEESWTEYHQINARLRMVSPRANLSSLRRKK